MIVTLTVNSTAKRMPAMAPRSASPPGARPSRRRCHLVQARSSHPPEGVSAPKRSATTNTAYYERNQPNDQHRDPDPQEHSDEEPHAEDDDGEDQKQYPEQHVTTSFQVPM
jgi:hypothetical protein